MVIAKFLSAFLVALIALLFTLVYVFSISILSTGNIDGGGIAGSYIGLLMLCAVFAAIGVFTSSLQSNAVISFLLSALICYIVYAFFSSLARLDLFQSGAGYYISLIGIQNHYENRQSSLFCKNEGRRALFSTGCTTPTPTPTPTPTRRTTSVSFIF